MRKRLPENLLRGVITRSRSETVVMWFAFLWIKPKSFWLNTDSRMERFLGSISSSERVKQFLLPTWEDRMSTRLG